MGNDGCRPRTRHCRAAERSLDYLWDPSPELLGNITSKGLKQDWTSSVVDRALLFGFLLPKGMVWFGRTQRVWRINYGPFLLKFPTEMWQWSQMDTPVKTLAAAARVSTHGLYNRLLTICLNLGFSICKMGSWDQNYWALYFSNAKIWLCNQSESQSWAVPAQQI